MWESSPCQESPEQKVPAVLLNWGMGRGVRSTESREKCLKGSVPLHPHKEALAEVPAEGLGLRTQIKRPSE